ncbi:hypothetical protein BATDEDRAFT_86125 [Batrachochytrium dendrobatidis JAM81]|uniref:BTB domain-containing protein n=2 Tax=Batrachochytrium dendrobatidis TaxID=109871 RepID=F4NXB3_BATDJ|nr:uncharacterized protein BATDEDRAFT_86125 [Batrachochytrium dendrobatidis JAM81]EGF82645.1 hypothetical protein BATDEDRAFT_86125 [Batrachochytrium dendrobatidis JAM81]KAK5673486.1 hypothetical protein QVD99_000930 [Batrachochytrium dendrobatidis]OAJ39957.1 hypothetical protein BDEG_23748 [Batrachochytrium dendrobatidis JEL423]|eukprot:XP_006677000.1 hypothetical protein BATDEDRAFT_86125 [Batrachochytrium dendrobatidis JAM81]
MDCVTHSAHITWTITNFHNRTGLLVSPPFGPSDCQWELNLYPQGNGFSRGSHIGLFLKVIKSSLELQSDSSLQKWSRPILYFHLAICDGNSGRNAIIKERNAQGSQGFGFGFSHPVSWGWDTMLPVTALDRLLTAEGEMVVAASVSWKQKTDSMMTGHSTLGSDSSVHDCYQLLFNDWLSDLQLVIDYCDPVLQPSDTGSKRSAGTLRSTTDSEKDGSLELPQSSHAESNPTLHTVIPAHRAILASRSTYFCTMLQSGFAESSQSNDSGDLSVIHITQFTPQEIRAMLEFIYTGNLITPPTDFAQRTRLLHTADYYQLANLYVYTSRLIVDLDINLNSIFTVLEIAHKYSSVSVYLKSCCMTYIHEHLKDLKKLQSFKEWIQTTDSRDLIVELFSVL